MHCEKRKCMCHQGTYGSLEMSGPNAEANGDVETHAGGVMLSACCHLLVDLLRQHKRHLHLDNRPSPETGTHLKVRVL